MTYFFNDVINRALQVPVEGGAVQSVYVSQEKVRIFLAWGRHEFHLFTLFSNLCKKLAS